ncbi:MAG: carboxypeptidase regulatory-like domain-containing protein [Candidatus Acidiferrales bacterium]
MNWKRTFTVAFALLALAIFSIQPAWSQATVSTGSIQGTVTDPQGGVITTATITISRTDTGQSITQSVTSSGSYSSGALTPATYAVKIEAAGFKTAETTVVVVVGQVSVYNAKLEVGASSVVVEVTGNAVQVNTDQAQVAGTLTASQIENLPINGRNFLDLAQLEPGVQIQDGGNFDPTKNGFSSISFGGRFGRSARIQVDGVDVSDENVGTTTTDIPASAISEFQLAQSGLDLSNDLTSSGAVNVVTKSGTNTLHGEGFGLFRDSTQAAEFPSGASFQRSQYGGDVGGAIIKDKLFFFIDGEKTLQHQQAGVLIGAPLDSFSGTFQAPFHDGETLERLDWNAAKNIRVFGRFNYFQNLDVGSFGGAATYSTYANEDRTKELVGGVDITQGSITHSFRAQYLKFVNVITDSVVGSDEPFADFPVSLQLPGGFASGPSDLAPQSTIQSDRQVKYDGSKVWRSHILRWGVDYNRIMGWSYASFFGLSPLVVNFTNATPGTETCPGGQTGASCPYNYSPDEVLLGNGQGAFTELQRFGKPNGGLGPDNRVGLYFGDSWKVKPNLSLNYGIRYDRDTGRTDSDLPPIPAINQLFPGYGDTVRQPNKNFAPQVGIAWDPKGDGKTVIRASIGIFYDNTVFNDVLFDRLLKLPVGAFNVYPVACFLGTAYPVTFGGTTGQEFIPGGNTTCGSPIGATLPAAAGTCSGITTAACIQGFQSSYQASYAANPNGPNASYIPNEIAGAAPITTGLLAPDYESPRSTQMNVGVQRELRPGMVLSADFVRNIGTHYLLGIDANHGGSASYFNGTAANNIINSVNASYGCGTGVAGVSCVLAQSTPANPITIGNYAAAGLDSPGDLGSGACPQNLGTPCAFGGINPNVGSFIFYQPIGRSVYNGLDLKLVQNVRNPVRGIKYLNFQTSYTFSRFVNAGSTGSAGAVSGGDQDFINNALDNDNPLRYMGPSSLDRTHQFSFGGYADIPAGFRIGVIAHFWSPLSTTPSNPALSSAGAIYTNDYTGDGTTNDPLPTGVTGGCGTVGGTCDYSTFNVGAYMRQVGPTGLTNAVNYYNTSIAGNPTPAGQDLINAGLMTLAQLQELGGVTQPVYYTDPKTGAQALGVVPGQVGLAWFKSADLEMSWVGHIKERFEIQPSVSFFNVFNFANFDSVGNNLTGTLNGSTGSINGTIGALRQDRIGVGSGAFNFGSPRVVEWGLKFTF